MNLKHVGLAVGAVALIGFLGCAGLTFGLFPNPLNTVSERAPIVVQRDPAPVTPATVIPPPYVPPFDTTFQTPDMGVAVGRDMKSVPSVQGTERFFIAHVKDMSDENLNLVLEVSSDGTPFGTPIDLRRCLPQIRLATEWTKLHDVNIGTEANQLMVNCGDDVWAKIIAPRLTDAQPKI